MFSKTMLLFVYVAFIGGASCAKVPRDDETYTWFLNLVDTEQRKEEIERQQQYKFVPQNYAGKPMDRHGQGFITCFDTNMDGNPLQGPINKRCQQTSAKAEPVCAITFDMKKNETQQLCFENPIQYPELCKDECEMDFKAYSYQGRNVYKGVGFCCCRTDMCNLNAQKIIADGMKRADKNLKARMTNKYDDETEKAYVPENWP